MDNGTIAFTEAEINYIEATKELSTNRELLEAKAEIMRVESRHVGELKQAQDAYKELALETTIKLEQAEAVIKALVLESRNTYSTERLEAKLKPGRKSTSWKSVVEDVAPEVPDEVYESAIKSHTKFGNPSVVISLTE